MKPYHQVPIIECGEPLVAIPRDLFAIEQPHPYEKLAAPYGSKSPYFLRKGVLEHLVTAQADLSQRCGWKLQIFDAYRPIEVQQFMVDYTLRETARATGQPLEQLTSTQRQAILEQVYQFWAVPSRDPLTPPPHSTGAAIDVTLLDAAGEVVDMGSPIDEISPRSHPDYFANQGDRDAAHRHRQLLRQVMLSAGFRQHPNEWWHFSLGDQMWAWFENRDQMDTMLVARYGAV